LSLTQFLCTLSGANFDVLINFYGFNDDENPKRLPTKYTLIFENLRNLVLVNAEEEAKKAIVEWVTPFIYEMINATNTTDGSWPGDIHALVLSKMLKIRIVIVSNYWKGFDWFDTDQAFFMTLFQDFQTPCQVQHPKIKIKCYLYWLNSKFSPYTCGWQNAMNHFEYLWETSDDMLTNDDKQRAYKGKGGINIRCHPFDLRELGGALVKRLAPSSEGSHQASSLLLTK
jgi:hypothetical protein